jgi:phospholipase C
MPQLTILHPTPNQIVASGQPFAVGGTATDRGMPEPVSIDSVTVAVDNQPPVEAKLTIVPRQPLTTVNFVATVQAPNVPGPHVITVKATNDGGISATKTVTVLVASASAKLQNMAITFNTYNDNLDHDTVLHVFVKNRRAAKLRGDSASTSLATTNYIEDKLAYDEKALAGTSDFNPFLGFAENLTGGQELQNNSTHTFNIPPRAPIPLEEVGLPVVNIHILPNGNDRWMFDYTITFTFDDGRSFSSSSNVNGVTGIILDQDNRDYAGICTENPFIPLPDAPKPSTDAVLKRLVLEFHTLNNDDDDNKDFDTKVNVHIVNRLSATASQDIAVVSDILPGTEFKADSVHSVDLPLASSNIRLADIVLPLINITIVPNGNDRWAFDYRITFLFQEPSGVLHEPFSSTTPGVILDQDHHKHTGVYSGRGFPTLASPPAQLSPFVIDHVQNPKHIPLGFVQKKLDDFVNNRNQTGPAAQFPPLRTLRFDHTPRFGSALPESYYDLKSIDANPPPPRSVEPPTFRMGTTYNSSPTSLGQLKQFAPFGDLYLNDINSRSLTAKVNVGNPASIDAVIDFETDGTEVIGGSSTSVTEIDLTKFTISAHLALQLDKPNGRVDLMAGDIGQVLNVTAEGSGAALSVFKSQLTGKLQSTLTTPDKLTNVSPRDALDATFNSWLLGGVIQSGNPYASLGVAYPNACTLVDAKPVGNDYVVAYTGPPNSFVYQTPADWPTAARPNPNIDFSPGTLANIDHIVVLTMENRSFDHMLGYLSLPESMGGRARTDVDGLKGSEFNMLNGQKCPIFRFQPGETIFQPDPPHDTEPVLLAINGGKMDGFAQSYANLRGNAVGPNIMGYHTADTVPAYDALARDFAVGQRWFAAHPGPTFCNRFCELTGRLNIDPWGFWEYSNSSPLRPVFTDTIFDKLSEHGVSWTYFEHFYCFLRFFERHTYDATNIASFDDPIRGFEVLARSGTLPSVSFIDPHFVELPPDGNCDGPPADVKEGQKLVTRIVEAVVASPKWDKTLLIITYDEHGGFYDHVPPSAAAKVAPELVDTHGVRVPAFVITPWVKGGSVFGRDGLIVRGAGQAVHFDHTSILKTIARRFMSQSPPYMGARYAAAHDLSEVLTNTKRPDQVRPFIAYNLAYGSLNLTVQGASLAAGAPMIQQPADKTPDQDFRFEEADDGFFIRTLAGDKYLTVDVPPGTNTGPGTTLHVKQDVKYPAGGTGPRDPNLQRWKLTAGAATVLDRSSFTVSCAAFTDKVLQPLGNSGIIGTAIVIGDPQRVISVQQMRNPWQVTSPLLGSGGAVLI